MDVEEEIVIKEEPAFEEVDTPMCEVKYKEEREEEVIKFEICPEPKYEMVEEEPAGCDLLESNVCHIIADADNRVSVIPGTNKAVTEQNKSKPKQKQKSSKVNKTKKKQKKKMFQCKICKAKFFSNHTLLLHEKVHMAITIFSCDKCEEVFASLSLLMEHQKDKKHFKATDSFQEKVRALNKKKFKCKACGLVFFSEKTFRFHVKIHAGLMKYSCDVCDEMFSTISDLAFHREKFGHGLKCIECGTICATVQEMDQHSKMHTKWKFFKCSDCNFSTVVQKHLRQHKATCCPGLEKDNLAPVTCFACNTLFQNKEIYIKHTCPNSDIVKPENPVIMDGNSLDDDPKAEMHEVEADEALIHTKYDKRKILTIDVNEDLAKEDADTNAKPRLGEYVRSFNEEFEHFLVHHMINHY